MLTIRLQRVGKKNQAAFRIVLAEKKRAAKKQAVEILGHYNPRTKEFGVKDQERLKYWIAQHAQISPTVHNLLISKGLLAGEKVKAWRPKVKATADLSAEAVPAAKVEVPAKAGIQEAATIPAQAETPAEPKTPEPAQTPPPENPAQNPTS